MLDAVIKPTKEQIAQPKAAVGQQDRQGNASPADNATFDPIENAMRRHPGLTRAEAEEMAEAFGF